MNQPRPKRIGWSAHTARILILFLAALQPGLKGYAASYLDTDGVTLLRQVTTNLNGAGIWVAQAEAQEQTNPPTWEVNPAAVGQPTNLFTYYSSDGSSAAFTNALGAESGHADSVAGYFYGLPGGVATNVAHVDNYDADYFYNSIIASLLPPGINGRVVNQSFIFNDITISEQQTVDSAYDNYAAQYNTLFVSGPGNGGPVNAPATCYNGIGAGAYGGATSVGPTLDNGRAKPEIVAPADATSFSTPQVAGAAALLLQAGMRGDGGADTNSATDIRTIKALLLNGAIKPANWTNSNTSPLDARYGAGVLNVFNSYQQLAGGKQTNFVSTSVLTGGSHSPDGNTNTVGTLSGWDFESISSSPILDAVNHYYFNVTNGVSNATFTATATLVWNRQQNQSGINNLDLFLYDANSGNLIASSVSAVDNVEHLFIIKLPPGRYDLQVLKHGSVTVSDPETYALAFEFFSLPLSLARSGANAVLAWPIYPTGFVLESTPSLTPPVIWSVVSVTPVVINNQNRAILDASNGDQFFRLRRP